MSEWKSTGHRGIRYREHPTRKIGRVRRDRYYSVRFTVRGESVETGIGWESEGVSLADAVRMLQEFRRNAKLGEGPMKMKDLKAFQAKEAWKRITIKDFVEMWYLPFSRATKTSVMAKKEAEHCRKWIVPAIGNILLKSFDEKAENGTKSGIDHVVHLRTTMEGKLASRSIEVVLQTFGQILKHGVRQGIIEAPIDFREVKRSLRIDNARQRFLSRDEAKRLIETLRRHDPTLADMAEFSVLTAARQAEVFGLDWGDIDLDQAVALIRDPKNRQNRRLYLTERAIEIIRQQPAGGPSEPVFRDANGRRFERLPYSWTVALRESGLNDGVEDRRLRVVWHTWRHSAAAWMAKVGIDLYRIARVLGHRDLRMTQRYSHLTDADLRQAIEISMAGGKSGTLTACP